MNSILLLGMPGGFEWIIIFGMFIIPGILCLWALIDLVQGKFTDNTTKLIWALIVIFVPFIGSILYLVIGRKQKVLTN